MDRDCIGCGIETMIHLPLQHAKRSGGRAVKAFGRPSDPVLLVCEHKQSQEFAAIIHAMPADGAVAIGRNHQSTITAYAHPPHRARHFLLPELFTLGVERSQGPFRSKHKTSAVWMNC